MQKRFLFLLLFTHFSLHAVQVPVAQAMSQQEKIKAPWFTGPLITPSPLLVPPGHYNIEPYIYALAEVGSYNAHWKPVRSKTLWNNFFQPSIEIGMLEWVDFQCYPTLYYNYTRGAGKWAVGDFPLQLNFQLYKHDALLGSWNMAFKLTLSEIIPLGKYQKLKPEKELTDIGGKGSWQTGIELVWGSLIYLGNQHFLSFRTSLEYIVPTSVHVKGFNAYGGGPGTSGTVYPGQSLTFDLGMEFNLTQNWAYAMDLVGIWSEKTEFQGTTFVNNSAPLSFQFSATPALEYNFNANMGLIFGSWFTFAGRNAARYIGAVVAFNYFY